MTLRVLADSVLSNGGVTADVLAYIPSPAQGVWQIGPFPLRAYALCIILGIVVAIWWGERRWRERGGQPGAILDVAMFAVPFGLVGGRLYHVATDWQKYFGADGHPIDALKIYQGGLGIWGAVFLGGVGAWIGCRVYRIPLPALGDAIAPRSCSRRPSAASATTSTRNCTGARPTCPGAWRSTCASTTTASSTR